MTKKVWPVDEALGLKATGVPLEKADSLPYASTHGRLAFSSKTTTGRFSLRMLVVFVRDIKCYGVERPFVSVVRAHFDW